MSPLNRIVDAVAAAAGTWLASRSVRAAAPPPVAPAPSVARGDSWSNAYTGVALASGRTAFRFAETCRLDDYTLESLFAGDGIATKICKAIPDEALRKGFRLHADDPKLHTAVMARLSDLAAPTALHNGWTWGRTFGGAGVFVGADDGLPPHLPLDLNAIRTVRFLRVHDKRALRPNTYYRDGLHPLCGEPETYRITDGGSQAVVHESRIIRFDGALTPNERRRLNQSWCDSEIQRCYDALVSFNGSNAAAMTLLQSSSQAVFAVKNLANTLAADKGETFRQRMELMELFRGLHRSILLDADGERYERVESSILSGVPDTVKLSILLLSAVSEIPVTVLMGQAPAGLNATGESDLRMWTARVVAAQTQQLKPRAERLVRILLRAKDGPTGGVEPDAWEIQFPSLYDLTPTESATVVKTVSEADKTYKELGVLTAEEIGASRFRDDGWNPDTVRAPKPAALPAQAVPGATAGAGEGAEKAADTALNGAQVQSLQAIVEAVVARTMPRDTAVQVIARAFQLTPAEADVLLASAGRGPAPQLPAQGTQPASTPGAEVAGGPTADADAPEAFAPALSAAQLATAREVVAEVSARKISRATGLGMLQAAGLTAAQAARVMGDEGQGHFTAPPPEHAAEIERLRGEHAAAQASQRSAKAMLAKVLEANRSGKLARGNLFKLASGVVAPKADAAVQHMDAARHTGLAIVLPVPAELAKALAVEGGEPASDLHVTLAFLGEASALDAEELALLRALVRGWAKAHAPMAGVIAGQGRFLAPAGQPDPVYLTPDVPDLACAREALIELLCAAGFEPSSAHGFSPHITTQYVPKGAPGPAAPSAPAPSAPAPVTFDAVGLWAGDEREQFALTGEPDETA